MPDLIAYKSETFKNDFGRTRMMQPNPDSGPRDNRAITLHQPRTPS